MNALSRPAAAASLAAAAVARFGPIDALMNDAGTRRGARHIPGQCIAVAGGVTTA